MNVTGKESMDGQWVKEKEEMVSDEPDYEGSCLWSGEAALTPEQLLGGFSSSYWWAFAALRWPHVPDWRREVGSLWGPGVEGVIYFTSMSRFMGHTTQDGLKC